MSTKGHVVSSAKITEIRRWMLAILLACSVMTLLAGAVLPAPASSAAQPQAKKWADQMPDGDGKKLIVAKCQLCHTLERVVTAHRTKDDWDSIISQMVEQGAALSDDESKTVTDYLAANYSPGSPAAAASGTAATLAQAPGAATGASATMIVDPDQTQFTAIPDSLGFPKGVTMAVVSGDPTKAGLFSFLLKLPADQMVPPHSESGDADLVVLRGTYEVGNGSTFDATKLQAINAGGVLHLPAQARHFGHAKGATVILLYGVGPLSLTW